MLGVKARLTQAKDDPLLRASLKFGDLDLRHAILSGANLENAVLGGVRLTGAIMGAANLRDAYLGGAKMEGVFLDRANLEGTILRGAQLARASLRRARARFADLGDATLDDAIMRHADLREAQLIAARMRRVDLREGMLQRANFIQADLTDAYLYEAQLEGTLFTDAILIRCDLRRSRLDATSRLNRARLDDASLEQASLGETNLAVVEWKPIVVYLENSASAQAEPHGVRRLGDEIEAREAYKRVYTYDSGGRHRVLSKREKKTRLQRVRDYRAAERAYRALSVALSDQGLTRDATRFQYKSEVMGRKATFHERNYIRWLASGSLDFFAGYGIHQIWRLLLTYLGAIGVFCVAYWLIGQYLGGPHITWLNAALLSFNSFHGRGIGLGSNVGLSDTMRTVAIAEGIVGVLIEALLVAALVRRITGD